MVHEVVLQFGDDAYDDLVDLVEKDVKPNGDHPSKDSVVNDAVLIYAELQRLRRSGQRLYVGRVDLDRLSLAAFDWGTVNE